MNQAEICKRIRTCRTYLDMTQRMVNFVLGGKDGVARMSLWHGLDLALENLKELELVLEEEIKKGGGET